LLWPRTATAGKGPRRHRKGSIGGKGERKLTHFHIINEAGFYFFGKEGERERVRER
jgi:hypothetical protein